MLDIPTAKGCENFWAFRDKPGQEAQKETACQQKGIVRRKSKENKYKACQQGNERLAKSKDPEVRKEKKKQYDETCPYSGDKWNKFVNKKTPELSCSVRSKSLLYRICWCENKDKCNSVDEIIQQNTAHCLVFSNSKGWHQPEPDPSVHLVNNESSAEPELSKNVKKAKEILKKVVNVWLASGTLQSNDMTHW